MPRYVACGLTGERRCEHTHTSSDVEGWPATGELVVEGGGSAVHKVELRNGALAGRTTSRAMDKKRLRHVLGDER